MQSCTSCQQWVEKKGRGVDAGPCSAAVGGRRQTDVERERKRATEKEVNIGILWKKHEKRMEEGEGARERERERQKERGSERARRKINAKTRNNNN